MTSIGWKIADTLYLALTSFLFFDSLRDGDYWWAAFFAFFVVFAIIWLYEDFNEGKR
jgi:hypothetical protein